MNVWGITNKRAYLARTLGRLGVLRLIEQVVDTYKPALIVLTYHRITERCRNHFYDSVISAEPQSFRAQMEWLRKRMHILTLQELDDRVQAGVSWKEPAALVTFDDGYRDNFEEAVPILKELNVPATFFIPTEFVESPKLPWWDNVAYVIKTTHVRNIRLEHVLTDDKLSLSIELEHIERDAAIITIIRAILDDRIVDLPRFLYQLAAQADVSVEAESLNRALFMSWEQVQYLADQGGLLAIGSHTNSHHNLAKLDVQAQRYELVNSKRILEERLGHEVLSFAYPFGWPGTYTQATKTMAHESGYRLAFASHEGVNRPDTLDPFEIKRFGIGSGDSPVLLRARAALYSAFGRSFL